MSDFWSFRRMVTPMVIEILFYLGCFATLITGVVLIAEGAKHHDSRELLSGVGVLLFGPLVVRIYAEILIVVFRINETLTDLRALAIWTAEQEHSYGAEDSGGETDA
jgi:hypothetical protein